MLQLLSLMTLALAANNPDLAEAQSTQTQYPSKQQSAVSKTKDQITKDQTTKDQSSTTEDSRAESTTNYSSLLTNSNNQSNVKTLPSGVKYKVLQEGTGESPGENDFIRAKYTMSFVDGKLLSSSSRKDAPQLLEVAALPKGLQEAVKQMKTGSHWIIYIPADLAYGSKGYKSVIPANSPLIFDLELSGVKNPPNEEVTSVIEEFTEKN